MRRVRRRGRSFVPISPDKERRTRGGEAIAVEHGTFLKMARCIGHRGSSHTHRLFRYSRIGCAI